MAYTYGEITKCKLYSGNTDDAYECRLGYQVEEQKD